MSQKPLAKRTFPKLAQKFREKLEKQPEPINFPGFFDKGIKPFVIIPGRQIITSIEAPPKIRSLNLPANPCTTIVKLQNQINQATRSSHNTTSDNSQATTAPSIPLSSTKSSKMDVDRNPEPISNSGNSAFSIDVIDSSTVNIVIPESLPTGLDMLASASLDSVSNANNSQPKTTTSDSDTLDKTESNLEKVENVKRSFSSKDMELNRLDFLSQAAELVLAVEPPRGLDMLSQAASQVTNTGESSDQQPRDLRLKPIKNMRNHSIDRDLSKLQSSKFSEDLRMKIRDDSLGKDMPGVFLCSFFYKG